MSRRNAASDRDKVLRELAKGPIAGVNASGELASRVGRRAAHFLWPLLKQLEVEGLIKRTVKGTRTTRLAITARGRREVTSDPTVAAKPSAPDEVGEMVKRLEVINQQEDRLHRERIGLFVKLEEKGITPELNLRLTALFERNVRT